MFTPGVGSSGSLRRLAAPARGDLFTTKAHGRLRELAALYWLPDTPSWRLRFALGYLGLRARDATARWTEGDG